MQTLISFGEAITTCKKSPEKLFVLLDMYETMSDLEPEVHTYIHMYISINNDHLGCVQVFTSVLVIIQFLCLKCYRLNIMVVWLVPTSLRVLHPSGILCSI
jgi:hypothetical protein